jgi:hypothetical protein
VTSQLTATTIRGAVETTGVTWQSQAPNVATVSATGLVTAVGVGTSTITAAASGTTPGRLAVVVEPPGPVVTVTTCQAIKAPGAYVLGADLTGASGACLVLNGVGGVQLDCRGHAVSNLSLSLASTITISNCAVTQALVIENSNGITASNCTLGAGVSVQMATSVVVTTCVITAPATVTNGANVEFIQDTITSVGGNQAVLLTGGSNNQVRQSTITGGYDGSANHVGTDDGIQLENETGDTIQGNAISGFFDLGIEGIAAVATTTVANNTLSNVGYGAVGSFWCTNWTGNVIRGNNVTMAPDLALVVYSVAGKCGTTFPPPVLSGNQFIANVFRNPIAGTLYSGPSLGARMIVNMPGTVTGNLVEDDDFGSSDGPNLIPLSGFIDGGGNICGAQNPAVSNFICTSVGSAALPYGLLRSPVRNSSQRLGVGMASRRVGSR